MSSMPFSAPKVKAFGIMLRTRIGPKYYTKYYTNSLAHDYSKTQYDVKTEAGIQNFQKVLTQRCFKINVAKNPDPEKTQIFSVAGFTVLFKVIHELIIFLFCEDEQNFVLMQNALNCLGKVLLGLTTQKYDKETIEENLSNIVIAIDEIFDDGVILCLDENQILERLKMRQGGEKKEPQKTTGQNKGVQQSTSAFNSFFGFAKNTLQKTLNLG